MRDSTEARPEGWYFELIVKERVTGKFIKVITRGRMFVAQAPADRRELQPTVYGSFVIKLLLSLEFSVHFDLINEFSVTRTQSRCWPEKV